MPETANYSPYGHPKGHADADGNWVRNADQPAEGEGDTEAFSLELAIAYDTADAATLYTVPAGQELFIENIFWDVTTGFTGGSSSAIGVSSDQSGLTSKGSLLGGASGDVTATLGTAGQKAGTAGSVTGPVTLQAGKKIRFDRITSAFTAGAGKVRVLGRLV